MVPQWTRTVPACVSLAWASVAGAQCQNPVWSNQFGTAATGLSGDGTTLVVFDPDGAGPLPPDLYVGGYFASAAGVTGTRGIARWNGQMWTSVGGGLTATGYVAGLGVFDPDGLGPGLPVMVAIGRFLSIGGVPVHNAASWNGNAWTAMGQELDGPFQPTGMEEYDPDGPGPSPRVLVVGDWGFNVGAEFGGVAQWNGTTWSILPVASEAHALAVYDEDGGGPALPALFVGRDSAPGLTRWDGTQVTVVGGGLTRSAVHMCSALRVIDEDGPGPGHPRRFLPPAPFPL